MSRATEIRVRCGCGEVELALRGQPIMSVECCCSSCVDAASRMVSALGRADVLTPHGTTPFAMYRKDRVDIVSGAERLEAFRLSEATPTRRVYTSCCHTPVCLEFQKGHWLSVYTGMFSEGDVPAMQMRTMAIDREGMSPLPQDIPNSKRHSLWFMSKLLKAWISMGFRVPAFDVREVELA